MNLLDVVVAANGAGLVSMRGGPLPETAPVMPDNPITPDIPELIDVTAMLGLAKLGYMQLGNGG